MADPLKLVCDRCGKTLLADEDVRYKARIEVYAAYDPMEVSPDDLAQDHRPEIQRIIQGLEEADPAAVQESVHAFREFDLCSECRHAFLRNPLGG